MASPVFEAVKSKHSQSGGSLSAPFTPDSFALADLLLSKLAASNKDQTAHAPTPVHNSPGTSELSHSSLNH